MIKSIQPQTFQPFLDKKANTIKATQIKKVLYAVVKNSGALFSNTIPIARCIETVAKYPPKIAADIFNHRCPVPDKYFLLAGMIKQVFE